MNEQIDRFADDDLVGRAQAGDLDAFTELAGRDPGKGIPYHPGHDPQPGRRRGSDPGNVHDRLSVPERASNDSPDSIPGSIGSPSI